MTRDQDPDWPLGSTICLQTDLATAGPPSPSATVGWTARSDGAKLELALMNDWAVGDSGLEPNAAVELLNGSPKKTDIRFNADQLKHWDSSLLVFLSMLRQAAVRRQINFDETGLPAAAKQLLAMLPDEPKAQTAPALNHSSIESLGRALMATQVEILAVIALVGDELIRASAALRGKAKMRRVDLFASMYDTGIAALPMVALVNVLVGGILAFVGAVQLRRFGADIYIANLVGVAEVREMAAVMSAIVIAGRTGGAYAAEIAAMQGSDELDALRVIGIPVQEYLILPRVAALTVMMPILYLYGSAVGILGGFIVSVSMLNLSAESFLAQTRSAVTGTEVIFGLAKSVAFGGLIAIAGCRIGLKAGRSSNDVGHAATSAVVVGIVGIIALDALFAVCANALGI